MSYISSFTTNLLVDASSTNKIVVLPPASNSPQSIFYIKDYYGKSFSSTIYITTTGGDTIDNQRSPSTSYGKLSTNYGALLLASDGATNWMILQNFTANNIVVGGGPVSFQYTGALQSYIVPVGVTSVFVQMWGAGGSTRDTYYGRWGGAGAYLEGVLSVIPGTILNITVGAGGNRVASQNIIWGNGGRGSGGGNGGGFSAIATGGNYLVIVGGGGAAGTPDYYGREGGAATWTGTAFNGGSFFSAGGGGGSQIAGGAGDGGGAGSLYTGGNGGGGGGGGGYYGGGATGGNPGGGGGSSFINNLANASGSNSSNGYTAPNQSSPRYITGVANGIRDGRELAGNGLVWITPF